MTGALAIAVAQPRTVAHDVTHNARRHADAVRSARARAVVFPEMSLTGYEFDAAPLDPSDRRLTALVDACTETGTIALAGAPVGASDGRAFIGVVQFRRISGRGFHARRWPLRHLAPRRDPGRRGRTRTGRCGLRHPDSSRPVGADQARKSSGRCRR